MSRAVSSSRESLWRSRLQRFQASGLSVTRFCQNEQVSVPSFYQWRKRLGATTPRRVPAAAFVPVRLSQAAGVEIHLPNGSRICLPPGDTEALQVAIETAGRLEANACST